MRLKEQIRQWEDEERSAAVTGWDFSHIRERYCEEDSLPWEYEAVVRRYLTPQTCLLVMDTGGGELLLSLKHPYHKTAATEAWEPNIRLCRERLLPLGIDFRETDGTGLLPFPDETFELVINRHGDYQPEEVFRILSLGGTFVTQQVGGENDRELRELLLPEVSPPYPEWNAGHAAQKLAEAGFSILQKEEAYTPIRFFDTAALVWFAKIIEWEFPGFSVSRCLDGLCEAQKRIEQTGCLAGTTHRFLLAARKPN